MNTLLTILTLHNMQLPGTVKNNILQWQTHFVMADATTDNIADGQLQSRCEVPLGCSEDAILSVLLDWM